jgi:proteasome activator subunit 4
VEHDDPRSSSSDTSVFPQTVLTLIPVLTSFLPPTQIHLYIPSLFKLWEAFNSNVTDERLIEMCGELSEEHVAGKPINLEDGYGAEWKDVGIWTESEWAVLVGKALASMSGNFLNPK